MQINHQDFTIAAENAAWEAGACERFHAMGEELVAQAAAVLLLPAEVRHFRGRRIAGEICAGAAGVKITLRRAFAGVGAELELRHHAHAHVLKHEQLQDLEAFRKEVREFGEREELAVIA